MGDELNMQIRLALPVDSDGFVRRACPTCGREFKWHSGRTEDAPADVPAAEEYFCPYCGSPASADQWFTEQQVEYARQIALAEVMPRMRDQLKDALEALNRSGLVTADVRGGDVGYPPPLVEADDMLMVASPCHAYEPVKIEDGWSEPVHCLVCGHPYRLPPH